MIAENMETTYCSKEVSAYMVRKQRNGGRNEP